MLQMKLRGLLVSGIYLGKRHKTAGLQGDKERLSAYDIIYIALR